ncbi:MAG: hypothetical protein HY216_04970 [Candidatus Rokubacteria bacterium]|nr:hypothetical protein [Candidatus Rokubacteria bacterium]
MAFVVGLTVRCSTAEPGLQPVVLEGERHFTLDWASSERNGRPEVVGHIRNLHGIPATNVRLLVQGLDGNGQVKSESIGYINGSVSPGASVPFVVRPSAAAEKYRLSVFQYDWMERGSGGGDGGASGGDGS